MRDCETFCCRAIINSLLNTVLHSNRLFFNLKYFHSSYTSFIGMHKGMEKKCAMGIKGIYCMILACTYDKWKECEWCCGTMRVEIKDDLLKNGVLTDVLGSATLPQLEDC